MTLLHFAQPCAYIGPACEDDSEQFFHVRSALKFSNWSHGQAPIANTQMSGKWGTHRVNDIQIGSSAIAVVVVQTIKRQRRLIDSVKIVTSMKLRNDIWGEIGLVHCDSGVFVHALHGLVLLQKRDLVRCQLCTCHTPLGSAM